MFYTMFLFGIVCIFIFLLKLLLNKGPDKIKYYLKYFIFLFGVLLIATVLLPYNMLKPRNPYNMKLFTRAMGYVTKCVDVECQIRNAKFLQEDGGAIIIGNHQSTLDTLALCHIWNAVKYAITVIVKKELFYALPFGPSAYLAGVIFINRNNSKSAYKELQETKELILNQKIKIWFFPEGTRNKEYTKLLPFKKGAFNLAVEAQVPIIPVVISPYYFVNNQKCIFNKGHVVVQCLEPVPTAGLTRDDVPGLIKICYDNMTAACKELSQEISCTKL